MRGRDDRSARARGGPARPRGARSGAGTPVEAAERLGDPAYLPLLESLQSAPGTSGYFERVLADAIAVLRTK